MKISNSYKKKNSSCENTTYLIRIPHFLESDEGVAALCSKYKIASNLKEMSRIRSTDPALHTEEFKLSSGGLSGDKLIGRVIRVQRFDEAVYWRVVGSDIIEAVSDDTSNEDA